MARVPTYDNFQASPNALPQSRLTLADMPDVAGRQAQQMGQSMQRFGGEIGQIAADMQAQANQVRFDAAATQAREKIANLRFGEGGYENLRGGDALFRPDNKYLPDEYTETLQKEFDAIAGSLGNDAQKQVFAKYSNDLLASFRTGAMEHTNREYKVFHLSQAQGTIAQRTDDIIRSGGDIDAIERAINGRTEMADGHVMYVEKGLRQAAYEAAKLTGASDIESKNMARKAISEGIKSNIAEVLDQNNVTQAAALLDHYREQMEASDVLNVQGKINTLANAQISMQAVTATEAEYAQALAPNDMTRLREIRTSLESGGRDFNDDGTPLTSSKGALYKNQVMPSTARNPGFGIRPADESGTPQQVAAEYNRVGDELLAVLVKRYGNASMALAAYNSGAGTVDAALKEAEKKGTADWPSFLPQETRDYIAKGARLYDDGKGAPKRPTELEFVDTALRKLGPYPTPEQIKLTTEESKRRFDLIDKAHKQREEEAVATAMRGIIENGGRYTDLPVSVRSALPPKEVDNLISFSQKIAKGDDSTSLWLYNELTSNPDQLAKMSDDEFFALRRELSETDFKYFSKERAKLMGTSAGGNEADDLNTQAIKQNLDERLWMIGINPSPSPKFNGGKAAERVGGIRKFVKDYFRDAQREAGKKFNDAEVAQHLDKLFAKNLPFRGMFSPSSGPMIGMEVSNIPEGDKLAIKDAFKKHGVADPTDAQILDVYWKRQLTLK